jgi:hypothetical protein
MGKVEVEERVVDNIEVLDVELAHFVADEFGMVAAITYVLTFFEAVDGSTRWMPRRAFQRGATRSLHFPEGGRDEDFTQAPEAKLAYTGPLVDRHDNGRWTLATPDGPTLLDTDLKSLTWTEGDLVAVSGDVVGPACRLRHPDPDFPMMYTTLPFHLTGTIKNIPVRGAAVLVTIHMPSGADIFASPMLSRTEVAWVEFVNQHEDGSFENGLLVWGREGFAGMALGGSNGRAFATSDVEFRYENDGGDPEFARRLEYSGDGETVVWEALPQGGRWPTRADMIDGYRFRQGLVRRAGASPVVASYAFGETFQDRLAP